MPDAAEVSRKIDEYIANAEKENKYSVAGLALALGVDIETLKLYEKGFWNDPEEGGTDELDRELAAAVKRAKLSILKWLTENSTTARQSKDIFLMKNWFGYTDKQEKDTTPAVLDLGELNELGR